MEPIYVDCTDHKFMVRVDDDFKTWATYTTSVYRPTKYSILVRSGRSDVIHSCPHWCIQEIQSVHVSQLEVVEQVCEVLTPTSYQLPSPYPGARTRWRSRDPLILKSMKFLRKPLNA